jgi:hypothetical protein
MSAHDNHTPGPWKYGIYYTKSGRSKLAIFDSNRIIVKTGLGQDANSRLMAAAPEL